MLFMNFMRGKGSIGQSTRDEPRCKLLGREIAEYEQLHYLLQAEMKILFFYLLHRGTGFSRFKLESFDDRGRARLARWSPFVILPREWQKPNYSFGFISGEERLALD